MILRWLFSRTLRDACALRKHVQRLLNAQRDLMTPAARQLVQGALLELQSAIADRVKKKELRKQMDELEQVAGKWLRPYPHAAWRENVEVLLVALAVAMGIRTFFLQPFKIPTGSMQPTLYGVTSMPDFSPSTIDFSADRPRSKPRPGSKSSCATRCKSRPAGSGSRNGSREIPTSMSWPKTTALATRQADSFPDFQHRANDRDWRECPDALVSAGLRRAAAGAPRRAGHRIVQRPARQLL